MNLRLALLASPILSLALAACGGGGTPAPAATTPAAATPVTATTPAVTVTEAATPAETPTEAATPAGSPGGSPGAGAVPAEVDAAFCRFQTELGGAFGQANRDLGQALTARDVNRGRTLMPAVSASIERLRPDLATIATWAPASAFGRDLASALDAYEGSLRTFFQDPTDQASGTAVQAAGQRITAAIPQYQRLAQQYPEILCP